MEDFYRKYTIAKFISYEPGRSVMLASPLILYPDLPDFFIITLVNSREVPIEVIIHKTLSQECEDVVKLYDSWESNHQYFFSTEFLPDGTLRKDLEQRSGKIYSFNSVLQNCLTLSKVLKELHSKFCVHHSINPESIYLTSTGGVKLGSFYKSRFISQSMQNLKTNLLDMNDISNHIRMTINKTVDDFREDISALGKVFVEMALGRLCPELTTMNTEIAKMLNINFARLNYPKRFFEMIMGMLDTDSHPHLVAAQVFEELTQQIQVSLIQSDYSEHSDYDPDPINDSIYIDEYTESSMILQANYDMRENDSNSQQKIIKNSTESVENSFNQDLEPKANLVKRSNEEVCENEVSSIIASKKNYNIASMKDSQQQLIINQVICGICNGLMDSCKFKLDCSHCFHMNCISSSYTRGLLYTKKFYRLDCPICKISLHNKLIAKIVFQDRQASIKANLMIYATTLTSCPNCNRTSVKNLVDERFKAKNTRCRGCDQKFCTFCKIKNGHLLYCGTLNDFKKGKPINFFK